MDNIQDLIKDIAREAVAEYISGSAIVDPELISIADAAKLCGCSKQIISDLIEERAANGFPAVRLGTRTIKIDKRRLNKWLAGGGLGVSV